ncbi:MAG: hypothetical protein BGP06_02445 [Rhizobiales bacterium 65-9]|nr:hypothetical protein [Hyphomicrobiales bacterium]OJY34333.1 MAG: hypothetical protein BGP06_02445 [Rhizobiales bacterium 65-9]
MRYRSLGRSALDFTAALLLQVTLLGATILIFKLDDLRSAAFFTFALSICGPISLFASMSLAELVYAGDERYRNTREIALAQALAFVGLSALAGVCLALWDTAYLPVYTIISLARLADLLSALGIQVLRRNGHFKRISFLGVLQFSCFCGFAALALSIGWAPPYICVAIAMMLASMAQAGLSAWWLRDELANTSGLHSRRPAKFLREHMARSIAISLNSLQTNAPRYGLEFLASPQQQAAYSLISTLARAGSIALQSLFVPVVGKFRSAYRASPRRAISIIYIIFFALSALFTTVMLIAWFIAVHEGWTRWLGPETEAILTPAAGAWALASSGVYLFRFGVWQIVSLLEDGARQTRHALAGGGATVILGFLLIPSLLIGGAAMCEIIGNLLLVVLPFIYWRRAGKARPPA